MDIALDYDDRSMATIANEDMIVWPEDQLDYAGIINQLRVMDKSHVTVEVIENAATCSQ